MFRIAFMVEDRNLPKVLHALTGLVVNMEPPQPVGNVVVKRGKATQTSGAEVTAVLVKKLQEHPETTITSAAIKELILKAGGTIGSYSYYAKRLQTMKALKSKDRGLFTITTKSL